jgi:hypothetical protein
MSEKKGVCNTFAKLFFILGGSASRMRWDLTKLRPRALKSPA